MYIHIDTLTHTLTKRRRPTDKQCLTPASPRSVSLARSLSLPSLPPSSDLPPVMEKEAEDSVDSIRRTCASTFPTTVDRLVDIIIFC